MEDQIDLDRVDTYEIVNTGALLDGDFEPVGPVSADRAGDEGPLGTFWGIETFDDESLTTIANPVFLADRPAEVTERPTPPLARVDEAPETSGPAEEASPAAWEWIAAAVAAVVLFVGVVGYVRRGRRRRRPS